MLRPLVLSLATALSLGCRQKSIEEQMAADDTPGAAEVAAHLCIEEPDRYPKADCRQQALRHADKIMSTPSPYWFPCETAVEASRLFAPEKLPSLRGKCCALLAHDGIHPAGCKP